MEVKRATCVAPATCVALPGGVNFELKRLEPKLDIVEKPENRVHELTDSNGAPTNATLVCKYISSIC